MSSQIKVAHIAPIYYPIPTPGYGGVERVIDELIEAQQHIGMTRIRLYATSDSNTNVETRSTIPSCYSINRHISFAEIADMERKHYSFALADAQDCDIIHAHGTWILPVVHLTSKPVILSIYTDTADPLVQAELSHIPEHVKPIANSCRTKEKLPNIAWEGTVLEGVIPKRYPFEAEKEEGLVFVGSMIPRKGPHIAIQVAEALDLPLTLIGPRKPMHEPEEVIIAQEKYWQGYIAPYLDNAQIRFLGEMGKERLEYVKRAKAVLCPIQWEEPFGRIIAEAMACGTPVVAFRRGAIKEVIQHGVTGFVVDTCDEMIDAIRHINQIRPEACRDHVEQNLHMERVARDYLSFYSKLIKSLIIQ